MEIERIVARGHEHVRGTHESTLELTTDDWLTPAGDCIVGIDASVAPADFPPTFIEQAQSQEATLTLELDVAGRTATITGRGHPSLTFADSRSMVVRTSTYVDDRTVMIDADHAAVDIDREMIEALGRGTELHATMSVSREG